MAKGFNLTAEINLRGPSNVKTVIADIRRQLGTIDTAVTVKIDPQAANNANKLAGVLTRLNNVLTTTSTQSRLTATNISQLATALNSFQTSANAASRSLNGLPRNIAQTTQGIQRAAQQAATARTEIEEFGRQSALAVRRFAAFSLATGAIYSLVNAVSKATKEFIEFDRQIVRLTQITGDSYEQLSGLTNTITGLSTSLGVASSDLIGVADTLAQAGLSAKETEQALKALALTAVAPSFDSLNETVEGSIALMRQFGISTKDLEKSLSSINSVAAKFAVESSDIITAIQRTGGVFSAASKGVSEGTDALNEFIAVFTSVRATTRESAETIATGLRTIFTRIQRADTIEALKDYGVTLTDVEGKFVGAYRAVELLAQGLGKLDPRDLKFSQIVEELGGFRQIGKVLPLIQQFGTAQDALKTAYAGQGSLANDAIKAQASLAIQFAKTRENFVALIRDIGKSDSFKSLVSVGLTLANTFIKVADIAKPLLPILTSIAAVKGSEALFQFGSGFIGGFARQTPNSVGQNAGQALSGARNQQNAATAVNNTRALGTNTAALQSLTSAVQQLNSTIANNRRGPGPQTINKGGVVRAFARGGVVPGTGNSDTVPAMLQPGEFVIRKKAVETIGANNLHAMNKYGSGGSIRAGSGKRKRFADGGKAKIADIKDISVEDGDTFDATVTPTGDPFRASFRLWGYDAYETGNKRSRITQDKLQKIKKFNTRSGALSEIDDSTNPIVIPSFTNVKSRTTASSAADEATSVLKTKIGSFDSQTLVKKINEKIVTDGKFGRYAVDLGSLVPEELTTGRYQSKNFGGLIQKFAKGGKTKKVEGLLMSALKGYKDDLFGSSLPDILKTQGLSNILDKIEKAYGVSTAKVIGAGGENVAFDIGQEILKISRTGSGAQQLLRDYGVNKKAIQKIGNYQLPSNVPGVTGYRNIKAFGKLTAALQDKVSSSDDEKSLRDYELLQGKLAKAGQYWLDAGPSNMGYDKKGNPTVIDGLVFSKAFVNKNVGKDHREDIEVDGMMAESIYDRWSKKQKGRQKFAVGGLAGLKQTATRRVGIIDTDVLRDPTNKDKVSAAMKKLGITDTSKYSIELAKQAVAARKAGTLLRMRSIAGAAGSGKSSLATGVGANDDATLRRTIRSQILTPEDLAGVDEVLALTSTASDQKLEAYLKSADRTYILSSSTEDERNRVTANREQRDRTGQGLYGRKPGQTAGATTDFALDETILRDELGSKAVVLGRKAGSYGLRRKRDEELPEIIQAGGFITGGFAPPTRGHRGAVNTLLARMIKQNPNASIEDIVASVAPDLPMKEGSEGLQHAARYGIFPADFRALLSQINFGGAMISTQNSPPGSLPKLMEVAGTGGRRRFARLKGAMAVTSGKDEGVLGKYGRAGMQVEDIPRIEDISATKVREALLTGDDKFLTEVLDPEVASILMGNRTQLRNRGIMVPMLLEKIKEVAETEKANYNAQVAQLLASAPGGPYKNVSAKLRENAPDLVERIDSIKSQRDRMYASAMGYRAYNVIQALSSQYPELYALDPTRKASVSTPAIDLKQETILGQISEGMKGVFSATNAPTPESSLQQAILQRVQKETATRGSGILPASNEDILSTLGDEVIPNDSKFGQFAGKTILQHLKKGKNRLPYWLSGDYKSLMRRPGEIAGLTEEDVAAYTATREYVSNLFKQKQKGTQQTLLEETAQKIAQTQMLAIVGLKGKNAITGPLTWNLGNNAAGEPVSVDATIMERVLPPKYKAVADYINEQTGNIVNTAASMLTGSDPSVKLDAKKREVLNQGNIEGGILEQLIATLGAGVLDDAARTRPVDFPNGIGEVAAKIFGIDPNIPTEAKRTIDSGTRDKAIKEFQRHFRGVYGVAEPSGDLVQQFARGGKVDDLLVKYKDIIKSIMPAEYIGQDGLLKLPDGSSRQTKISSQSWLQKIISGKFGNSTYQGLEAPLLKFNFAKNKDMFDPQEYSELMTMVDSQLGNQSSITLGNQDHLAHETFHDIQSYLYGYYPQIASRLNDVTEKYLDEFQQIYSTSSIKGIRSYDAESIVGDQPASSLGAQKFNYNISRSFPRSAGAVTKSLDSAAIGMSRSEIIPLLIQASQKNDPRATKLLETIFTEAGLNSSFASTMPQGYFWGGKVDPLAKKYGLSQSEFEEQKKIAKFMGLNDKDFEEKLRLFASQKQRIKGSKFAALDSLAESSTSVSRLTAEQQALNEFLQTNKFAEGGAATLEKASKNYGKISITEDGNTLSAGYFKGNDRSGYVNAYKMRDYLYYVGLSKATSGYGPRLYDVIMEAASEKGAMLTSDRSSVSGDAKRVWEYYFKNRGDVKKTPLKPDDWTRNQALIDPKLYGKEETWPPATDPAWVLQSGYSKSPSLINDPNSVVRTNRKQDSRSMALEFFQRAATGGSIRRFANGGSPEDTVPALLTPGEFVINKKAAQSIGYSKLQKLNHADKLKGYNKGGVVGGVQRFNIGGNVASDAQLTAISDEMSKALKALPDSIRDVVREFNIQTTQLALGDTFDKINLKLRQQLLIAQKDISNLGPEFVEGVRKVLGEGIKRLNNIELDTIRSSSSYKGPGKEYYADVEKARAGRKVFESGASDAKDLMQAMARSVAGVGGEQYPKPLVSTPKMRPEDYYSRLNYSDIGGSGDIGESGRKYAKALAGEDPIKVNALVERLRKEMEDAAKAAGIAISKWGRSESWAVWDVGKQLHLQQNPGDSDSRYNLGNPLDNARIQKEIVQRHLAWEATGGKNPETGERLSSAALRDLGAMIEKNGGYTVDLIAAIKAQTDATKTQTEATKTPTQSSGSPPADRPNPYSQQLESGISYNPTLRKIRRNTREKDATIQQRYRSGVAGDPDRRGSSIAAGNRDFVLSKLNTGLEAVGQKALILGGALAVPLEGLSRLAGSTTVTGKVLSSLATSSGQLAGTFNNAISAIRGFANFIESNLGKRLLGSLSQTINSVNLNKLLGSRSILTGGLKLGDFATSVAGGAAAAVAITQAFIDYSNALKQSRIEQAQKRQEEALTKSAEALEKYSKTQDRVSLELANTFATAAASAALDEANARTVGDRKFGIKTGLAVGGGALAGGALLGGAIGTLFGPGIGTAIGAAIGGSIAGALAQYFGADRQMGATADESARSLSQTRSRLEEVFSNRLTSGETSEDIMRSPDWAKQSELIARSNASIEALIRSIEADRTLTEETKRARVAEIIQLEASARLREQEQVWLKQKGLIDLDNATKAYTRSLRNMFANMEEAINKTTSQLDNFGLSMDLAEASVRGQAKIGLFRNETIDTIKNPRVFSREDREVAANAASSFFGSEQETIRGLLTVGPQIESAVLAAIQAGQTKPGSTTDEAIGASIRRSVRDELASSSLPQDLSDKLGQQIAIEMEKRRKSGDDKVDFRDLEEAIPGLKDSIDALKGAQDIAIKALEAYTQSIGVLVDRSNQSVELLIQAGEFNRKALDIQFNGNNQLTRAFGGSVDPSAIRAFNNQSIRNQTGGATSPAAILENLDRLEKRRAFQNDQIKSAENKGRSGAREALIFTDQLSKTTKSLRDNQQALQELANNSEAASAALEKISELQAKTQAGQNIIERYVTSTREDNFKLSAAFERLDNNMRGMLNNPLASRNVRDAMMESDNPALAADQAAAQDRRDTLDAFNMIAPFLGNGREQNALRANVLESMLKETGIGLTPMFNDVLKSLRNPEGDSEMSQLIEQYKESIKIQSKANEALGQLNANFAQNLKQSSEEAFKNAIQTTLVEFERAQTNHLQKIEEILSKGGTPATTRASGGIVYRDRGGSIFQPKGTDTVPAMLTPGEFVVNRASTQKYGSVLKAINDNKYSTGGPVKYYASGGVVSPSYKSPMLRQDESSFTESASVADGYDKDYYKKANGPFSVNRHYAPTDLREALTGGPSSAKISIVTLKSEQSIIPTALQPLTDKDKYPVSNIWSLFSSKEYNDRFQNFITDGVQAIGVGIGAFPNYSFISSRRISPTVAASSATKASVNNEVTLPQAFFLNTTKSQLDKKKRFLSQRELDPGVINPLQTMINNAEAALKYNLYDRTGYDNLLQNQAANWKTSGKKLTNYANGTGADFNQLTLNSLTKGKAPAFMVGSANAADAFKYYPLSQIDTEGKASGLSSNNMQIVTGFVNQSDGGVGGFTINSNGSRSDPKVSILHPDQLFTATTDRSSNYISTIEAIVEDFNKLRAEQFTDKTIYSERYRIYTNEALAAISKGLIEKGKFEKNILDERKIADLDSLSTDPTKKKIDFAKLKDLYVWSNQAIKPNKNQILDSDRDKIGIDFPIVDNVTGKTNFFAWSTKPLIRGSGSAGSDYLSSIGDIDTKQYKVAGNFEQIFDAPWAKNNKINVAFPYYTLKNLPIFDMIKKEISKDYNGIGLDNATFTSPWSSDTINPLKLSEKYSDQILLASKSQNINSLFREKIKQWINSNAGQVPNKALDLGDLDSLANVSEEEVMVARGTGENDLERETNDAKLDIFGAFNKYKILAQNRVLYKELGTENFSNKDLDAIAIEEFKRKFALNEAFDTRDLPNRFPYYADAQLAVKGEQIKTKKSLLEDFIEQSSIKDMTLMQLAPWTRNIQDQRIGDLFNAGIEVPDNLTKVYRQTLAWSDKFSPPGMTDLMNQTEAKYPGKFQELMSLLQLAYYVGGGKTAEADNKLSKEFLDLQRGFFGSQDLSKLSVFEDSRVAGKKGKQWWKEVGPDWTGFARNNLSIIEKKQIASRTQEILNRAVGLSQQDRQDLAENINSLGEDGSVKPIPVADNTMKLIESLLDTTKVYTEGYRLDIADSLQKLTTPDGINNPELDTIKAMLSPSSDLVNYLAFKDAIISKPLSKVDGIRVQGDDRDIKAPRLANYVPKEEYINGNNPWNLYSSSSTNFNNISTMFKDVVELMARIGSDNNIRSFSLQNPSTIYNGPDNTFDGKPYVDPKALGADPITGKGLYALAYRSLVGTDSESLFDKDKNEQGSAFKDSTQDDKNVIYRSSGGPVGYYAGGGSIINFKPKGTDTVPAMLTPGEFVVNRQATQNNLPLLQAINSQNYQTGGKVEYLAQGSKNPVQQQGLYGLANKFINYIRSASNEEVIPLGINAASLSDKDIKQLITQQTPNRASAYSTDPRTVRMAEKPDVSRPYFSSARSMASQQNRLENPYMPLAEDPRAYSPSSRAEASRKARESYTPDHPAEAYISNQEAAQARREIIKEYRIRKDNLIRQSLMVENGPIDSVKFSTPVMSFESWTKKSKTNGRIVSYDASQGAIAIYKIGGTDILNPSGQTGAVTAVPLNLLSVGTQDAISSFMATRELSPDNPYPYQRKGMNEAIEKLEKIYGKDFMKEYRNKNRISIISSNGGPIYSPDQGYIASTLSDTLLSFVLRKTQKYPAPTAEAVPKEEAAQKTYAYSSAKSEAAVQSAEKPQTKTRSSDEIKIDGQEMRKWIDSTSNYAVVAKLVSFLHDNKDIKLLKSDNRSVVVPITKLSDFDQEYVRKLQPAYKQLGGMIYASNGQLVNFQPRGTDTIPAMLTPGEFVVNRQATQRNLPLLQSINKGYSNGGVVYLAEGSDQPVGSIRNTNSSKFLQKYWLNEQGQIKPEFVNAPYNFNGWLFSAEGLGSLGSIDMLKSFGAGANTVPQESLQQALYNGGDIVRKSWFDQLRSELVSKYDKLSPGSDDNLPFEQRPSILDDMAKGMIYRSAVERNRGTPTAGPLDPQQFRSSVAGQREIESGRSVLDKLMGSAPDDKLALLAGIGEKVIPGVLSLLLGGIGVYAGGGVGSLALGTAGALAGDRLGKVVNSFLWDTFVDSGAKVRLDQAIKTNRGSYDAGQWIGWGSELLGGAAIARTWASKLKDVTEPIAAKMMGRKLLAAEGGAGAFYGLSEVIEKNLGRYSHDIVEGFAQDRIKQGADNELRAIGLARGGLVSELSGLYQRRLTAQKEASAARDQWFVVPLKAGKTEGDTSSIFDNLGNQLPSSELLTLDENQLAVLYGKDSKLLKTQAETRFPWFDDKQHRLVKGEGIYRNQKQAFGKQDPAAKIIDELAYEFKAMPKIFEINNKDAYTDEKIDTEPFIKSLQTPTGAYVGAQTQAAAEMLQNRNNFLTTLYKNLEEATDMVMAYLNKPENGLEVGKRSAFAGEDPDNILTTQKAAVTGELDNIFGLLQNPTIGKYAKNVKNTFNRSRILDFGNAPKSLKDIIAYFSSQSKPKEKEKAPSEKPVTPVQMAIGGRVPYYLNNGAMVNFTPRGTDTVPAMLTPGEFVVNRRATQKNLPLLKQINSQNYQRGGVVQYYQQGSQGPVQQSGVGGMYSLSLDDKSISLMREFTSKFAEFSTKLANLTLPSLRIDETTLTSLNDFTKRFDNFSKELLKLNIPPVITITGKHDVNVNINGASVFSNMDKYVSNMIKNEINNAFAQLARETDGAITMNYSPSAYSNQNSQNLA